MKMLTPKYAIKSKHTRHVIPGRCCRVNRCLSAVIRSDNNRKREASRVRARARGWSQVTAAQTRARCSSQTAGDAEGGGARERLGPGRFCLVLEFTFCWFEKKEKEGKKRYHLLTETNFTVR